MLISIVYAINYDYIYNPYTGKLDRSIKLNQSGDNMTADEFFKSDGTDCCAAAAGGNVSGTGANTRLAIWSGASTLTSSSGLTWTNNILSITGNAIATWFKGKLNFSDIQNVPGYALITNLANYVGNWTLDKPNYYNKSLLYNTSAVDTKLDTLNLSCRDYTNDTNASTTSYINDQIDTLNKSARKYVNDTNTSAIDYVRATFINKTEESSLNVNSSDKWDNYDTASDLNNKITLSQDNITDEDWIENSQESNLNVNSSNYWDNLDSINTTVFVDNGGVLSILLSYWTNLFYLKTAIDSLSEMETIWGVDVIDSTEKVNNATWSDDSALLEGHNGSYYLDDTDTTYNSDEKWIYESANVFYYNETYGNGSFDSRYYKKTEIDTQGEMESIWSVNLATDTEVTSANTSIKDYADARDVIYNTSMVTYVGSANSSLKAYLDAQNTVYNTSMVTYVTSANSSIKSYADALDTATNTSLKGYVDTQDSAQDECSEITGCVENALTNSTDIEVKKTNVTGNFTMQGLHIDKINSTHYKLWS